MANLHLGLELDRYPIGNTVDESEIQEILLPAVKELVRLAKEKGVGVGYDILQKVELVVEVFSGHLAASMEQECSEEEIQAMNSFHSSAHGRSIRRKMGEAIPEAIRLTVMDVLQFLRGCGWKV